MTFIQEEQEVLSSTTVLAENGIFDKDEPTEDDIDSDDSDSEPFEPRTREEGVDSNLDDEESGFGRRGSNKNPTRGVMGTFAGCKGTQAGPKGTQAGPKGTQAGRKGTLAGGPKGCTKTGSKGTQADPKTVKK